MLLREAAVLQALMVMLDMNIAARAVYHAFSSSPRARAATIREMILPDYIYGLRDEGGISR